MPPLPVDNILRTTGRNQLIVARGLHIREIGIQSTQPTHRKKAVDLPRDDQAQPGQEHLGELDVEHQVERPHVVLAHELVLVRPRASVEAEGHEQQRQTEQLFRASRASTNSGGGGGGGVQARTAAKSSKRKSRKEKRAVGWEQEKRNG